MATYRFETITAAEAMSLQAGDIVQFTGAPSTKAVVYYLGDRMAVAYGSRTVEFANTLVQVSQASNLQFADGSRMFLGDGANDKPGEAFYGTNNPVAFYGGQGADTITGGFGQNFIHGNQGDDRLTGSASGYNEILGGQGADLLVVPTAVGGPAYGSYLHGNMGADTIHGGAGTDTLLGGQDNDQIVGNGGYDYISGDLGDDNISAARLGGWIYGGAGNDTIFGNDGGEFHMFGGDGDDVITSRGNATIDGGAGYDQLTARGFSHQILMGGSGTDYLLSADPVTGREGSHLQGGDDSDTLVSLYGGDTLWGGGGSDNFFASDGKAVMFGEAGQDTYRLAIKSVSSAATLDEIHDWTSEDRLSFTTERYTQPQPFSGRGYVEVSADDYAGALVAAETAMQGGADVIAVKVALYVVILADINGDNRPDSGIILTGVSLDAISAANIY